MLEDFQRIVVGAVVEPEHDDGAHLRPQRARIAAPLGGGLHPDHVAVGAFGEELLQPLLRQRRGVGPRDADHVEAVLLGFGDEPCFQKSRLV